MTAVIERASRIAVISRFLSCMRPTHNPWWVTGMDWFGFHRSIPALVRGIDHPPMSGVGTSRLATHAIAEIAGSRCNGGIQQMISGIIAKDWH